MKTWFLDRGYLLKRVESETRKVKFCPTSECSNRTEAQKGALLVKKYHALLKSLEYIINKHLDTSCVDYEVKHAFFSEADGFILECQENKQLSSWSKVVSFRENYWLL